MISINYSLASFFSIILFLIVRLTSTNTTPVILKPKPKSLFINLVHSHLILPKNTLIYNKYSDQTGLKMFPNQPYVMVNFSIGNPPIPQLALFDTGSKIIWVAERNCSGCDKKSVQLFHPENSKSYKEVQCHERSCYLRVGPSACNISSKCNYTVTDSFKGKLCEGIMAKDDFSFTSILSDGARFVPNSLFVSCYETYKIKGIDNRGYNGIFGLGYFSGSLVSDLGYKFSYCISNLHDPKKGYSKLYFGDDFERFITERKVDLNMNDEGFYSVSLDRLSMGEETIGVGPHRIILDTGTPVTWWDKHYLSLIKDVVKKVMSNLEIERYHYEFNDEKLCFLGNIDDDLLDFPSLVIALSGGGRISLSSNNIFLQQSSYYYCLFMRESKIPGSSVLGLVAQQNHMFTYDLLDAKLSIQEISCSQYDLM